MTSVYAPLSLYFSPAVGEEPPILLACLMACQEATALLTHSPTDRHAWFARPGPSWPAHRSNPLLPWSAGRQVQIGGAPQVKLS